jgi:hypothetical protein
MYVAFPRSDYHALSDSSPSVVLQLRASGISLGFPLPTSTPFSIPGEVSRVRHVRLKRNDLGGVFSMSLPLFAASQRSRGVDQVYPRSQTVPIRVLQSWALLPRTQCGFRFVGWHLKQGMPGCSFPVGLCTLLVNHHVVPQPNTTSWRLASSSWRLLGACCSHCRVVRSA